MPQTEIAGQEIIASLLGGDVSVETADVAATGTPLDLHATGTPEAALSSLRHRIHENREVASGVPIDDKVFNRHYLPFIAERYHITPDLANYIVVPVTIMTSDLPNRNLVAFPFRELSAFNPEAKCLSYETWRYAPTFQDHANSDIMQAKGTVIDVSLRRMKNVVGDLWKVVTLCAFDRSKDPQLVSRILSREIASYSMGAYVTSYSCSICGAATRRPTEPKCMHIPATRDKLNVFQQNGQPQLAHWNVGSFIGFEVSALYNAIPGAFPSTDGSTDVLIE